jgi:hypothetical protein
MPLCAQPKSVPCMLAKAHHVLWLMPVARTPCVEPYMPLCAQPKSVPCMLAKAHHVFLLMPVARTLAWSRTRGGHQGSPCGVDATGPCMHVTLIRALAYHGHTNHEGGTGPLGGIFFSSGASTSSTCKRNGLCELYCGTMRFVRDEVALCGMPLFALAPPVALPEDHITTTSVAQPLIRRLWFPLTVHNPCPCVCTGVCVLERRVDPHGSHRVARHCT